VTVAADMVGTLSGYNENGYKLSRVEDCGYAMLPSKWGCFAFVKARQDLVQQAAKSACANFAVSAKSSTCDCHLDNHAIW